MWLWDLDLHALGFKRKSERYWRCERRHERHNNEWQPLGHTSGRELRRLGRNRARMQREADGVAGLFVGALGGVLLSRR
jgi:hypothetical protein